MTLPVSDPVPVDDAAPPTPGFGEALGYWLRLGFISFGGPAGQIALMHDELVTRRRWISERRFLHALNYCMLLPGPEAQQLATYMGWLMHRTAGGLAAGVLFVLPSLFMLIGLTWVYLVYGQVPAVAAVLYGIKPAVTAIVLAAAVRIGSRTLRNAWLWALAVAAFVALYALDLPFPVIVAGAALAGVVGGRLAPQHFSTGRGHGDGGARPHARAVIDDDTPTPPHARFSAGRLLRVAGFSVALWALVLGLLVLLCGRQAVLVQMATFFTQAALLTFGGAYAVLPYVVQGAVDQHQWLNVT